PGIEDQELSVAAEGAGVNNPAVTRCCDLRPRTGRQRNALFDTANPVGRAEFAKFRAVHRQREYTFGRGEGDRGTGPGRVLESGWIDLATRRRRALLAGGCRGLGRALQVLFHLADQALEAVDLLGQRDRATAFRLEILFDGGLLALPLVDQRGQSG